MCSADLAIGVSERRRPAGRGIGARSHPRLSRTRRRTGARAKGGMNYRRRPSMQFPLYELLPEVRQRSTSMRGCRQTAGQCGRPRGLALRAAGAGKVFREVASGAKTDRAQLRGAIAALQVGDVLLVARLDRLARSTRDLLNTLALLGLFSLVTLWAHDRAAERSSAATSCSSISIVWSRAARRKGLKNSPGSEELRIQRFKKSPPPLAGGGWGRGRRRSTAPSPQPPPARGGGATKLQNYQISKLKTQQIHPHSLQPCG